MIFEDNEDEILLEDLAKFKELTEIMNSAFHGENNSVVVVSLLSMICALYVDKGASIEESEKLYEMIMDKFIMVMK